MHSVRISVSAGGSHTSGQHKKKKMQIRFKTAKVSTVSDEIFEFLRIYSYLYMELKACVLTVTEDFCLFGEFLSGAGGGGKNEECRDVDDEVDPLGRGGGNGGGGVEGVGDGNVDSDTNGTSPVRLTIEVLFLAGSGGGS